MKIFFSAGERSGDIAAARLLTAIRRRAPDTEATGIGGADLEAAGAILQARTLALGAVGVSETLRSVPDGIRTFWRIRRGLVDAPPDVAVLVGNDLFNALLGRWLKRRGVRTVSYFPPQTWVWDSMGLTGPIARSYDAILACFPSELTTYGARRSATVTYVGHYLADELSPVSDDDRHDARRQLGLDASACVVGLLPGSRSLEVQRLGAVLLGAAARLRSSNPNVRFVLSSIVDDGHQLLRDEIARNGLEPLIHLADDSRVAMRASDVLIVASGTASLEAALLGVPMVIVYRVAALTHRVIEGFLQIGWLRSYTFGLPNLLLGRSVAPELGQDNVTVERVAREVQDLLDDSSRRAEMRRELGEVRSLLSCGGGAERAAAVLLDTHSVATGHHDSAPWRGDASMPTTGHTASRTASRSKAT